MKKQLTNANKAIIEAARRGHKVNRRGKGWNPEGKQVEGFLMGRGSAEKQYFAFCIKINGKSSIIKFHRLMAYQKYGLEMFEEGIQVRHLNGNSHDNSYENILIGTGSENMQDIPEEERRRTAKIRSQAFRVLTNGQEEEILAIYEKNEYTQRELADIFNVSQDTICCAIKRARRKASNRNAQIGKSSL